jgi:hypothetical protein
MPSDSLNGMLLLDASLDRFSFLTLCRHRPKLIVKHHDAMQHQSAIYINYFEAGVKRIKKIHELDKNQQKTCKLFLLSNAILYIALLVQPRMKLL